MFNLQKETGDVEGMGAIGPDGEVSKSLRNESRVAVNNCMYVPLVKSLCQPNLTQLVTENLLLCLLIRAAHRWEQPDEWAASQSHSDRDGESAAGDKMPPNPVR